MSTQDKINNIVNKSLTPNASTLGDVMRDDVASALQDLLNQDGVIELQKQDKNDTNLTTTNKTIVGAINELENDKLEKGIYTGTAQDLNVLISGKTDKGTYSGTAGQLKAMIDSLATTGSITPLQADLISYGGTINNIDLNAYKNNTEFMAGTGCTNLPLVGVTNVSIKVMGNGTTGTQKATIINNDTTYTRTFNGSTFSNWNIQAKKNEIEILSGGTNVLVYDDLGKPSMMVRIPKFKLSDVNPSIVAGSAADIWHPMFIKNDVLYDFCYISKYQCYVENNRAYSAPGKDPKTNVTFDQARSYCTAKGTGWHLMTQVEWDGIALWSKKNGTMPRGNNYAGRSIDASHECGAQSYDWVYGSNWNNRSYKFDGTNYHHVGRVLTGSGPKTWAHNHETDGIYDMNGNVWEWVDGLKIVDGVAKIMINNNFSDAETAWIDTGVNICTGLSSGQPIKTLRTGAIPNAPTTMSYDCYGLPATTGAAPTDFGDDYFWYDATYERIPLRGGPWYSGSTAGVFALYLGSLRSDSSYDAGFRAAFLSNL